MAKKNTNKKIPLAVIITDTHLHEDNIEANKAVFRQARDLAKTLGLKEVLHGGDIFDSRKGQPQSVLNAFTAILDEFEKDKITLVAIPGNHDKTDYGSVESFIVPYRTHPGFYLVEEYDGIDLNSDNVHLYMIPFFADSIYTKHLDDLIKLTIGKKGKEKIVLLTHIGVSGAVMNNGIVVSTGIKSEMLDIFDKVLIGHYHDPQQLSDKIKYIGASLQHNFGESPTKGATILYDDLTTELKEFDFPKYINYEVDVTKITAKDVLDIKKEKEKSGDQIRVTLIGEEKDVKAFDTSSLKNAGIDVKKKQDDIKQEDIQGRVSAFTDSSILTSFEVFCEKNNYNHPLGLVYLSKALGLNIQIEEEEEDV